MPIDSVINVPVRIPPRGNLIWARSCRRLLRVQQSCRKQYGVPAGEMTSLKQ
jgi:hypothetical protein